MCNAKVDAKLGTVQSWELYTVRDRIFDEIPATNAVYTTYTSCRVGRTDVTLIDARGRGW
jgi:hypothetical protein